MNGAESLVRTLVAGGVDVCFTNPGTSEMHFVAALDRVEGMRCVLCLFEGVATGAADGWARMTERPSSTLLHLGPGLANGLANLHNAKRAMTPIVNVVGEHTTTHRVHDAPLTSDIEGLARPMSAWVRTGVDSRRIARDGADAIAAARTAPGGIATLILPADTAWGEGSGVAAAPPIAARRKLEEAEIERAAEAALRGAETLFFLGGLAVRDRALRLVAAIAKKTGARFMGQTSIGRVERGAGRAPLLRLPYPVDFALAVLADVKTLALVGAREPVAFFGYPGKPSRLAPPHTDVMTFAAPADDVEDALARLAERVGAAKVAPDLAAHQIPALPKGPITPESAAAVIANLLPEHAIVVDESITTGRNFGPLTMGAAPHDWLQITGGSIGIGPPLALGAAVACPDRKVVNLQADGSAMYTLQALWSQARERANVLTVIWSNRSYAILRHELTNVGANPGRKALDMLSLGDPDIDWVSLARGMGVDGRRVATAEDLAAAMRDGMAERGPFLIEAVM
jgi:acetolactate synthase-1/2/3 large subunit